MLSQSEVEHREYESRFKAEIVDYSDVDNFVLEAEKKGYEVSFVKPFVRGFVKGFEK